MIRKRRRMPTIIQIVLITIIIKEHFFSNQIDIEKNQHEISVFTLQFKCKQNGSFERANQLKMEKGKRENINSNINPL